MFHKRSSPGSEGRRADCGLPGPGWWGAHEFLAAVPGVDIELKVYMALAVTAKYIGPLDSVDKHWLRAPVVIYEHIMNRLPSRDAMEVDEPILEAAKNQFYHVETLLYVMQKLSCQVDLDAEKMKQMKQKLYKVNSHGQSHSARKTDIVFSHAVNNIKLLVKDFHKRRPSTRCKLRLSMWPGAFNSKDLRLKKLLRPKPMVQETAEDKDIVQETAEVKKIHYLDKIFVKSTKIVDGQLKNKDIKNYFSKFGNVISIEEPVWKKGYNRRQHVFVQFENVESTENALKNEEHIINGSRVKIAKCFRKVKSN